MKTTTNPFEEQVLEIVRASAKFYQRSADQIFERVDEENVNRARKVAMYLAREITAQSFPKLAKAFNRDHHTTIMDAHRKMVRWVNAFPEVRNHVFAIKEILEEQGVYEMSLPVGFQILKSS